MSVNKQISSFVLVAESALEQNISVIEKMHSRIRMNRFIGTNLFLIISLAIIGGYIYVADTYMREYFFVSFLLPLILCLPLLIILNKKSIRNKMFIYVLITLFEASFGSMTFYLGKNLWTADKLLPAIRENFVIVIILSLFLLFLYSLYYSCKEVAEEIIRMNVDDISYEVCIHLNSGKEIIGRLITITKKHDYVVQVLGESKETLIHNSSISTIKINDIITTKEEEN